MVGVWIAPVIAQVMMTLFFAILSPILIERFSL
jgi:hypothetical protein